MTQNQKTSISKISIHFLSGFWVLEMASTLVLTFSKIIRPQKDKFCTLMVAQFALSWIIEFFSIGVVFRGDKMKSRSDFKVA